MAAGDEHGTVVEVEGAVIRFLLGGGESAETADNLDAHIHLADGTRRYATFCTPEAIVRILRKDAATGETGGGRYFWCRDQVIVPRPGIAVMVAAVEEMIRSGDIEVICGEIAPESDGG